MVAKRLKLFCACKFKIFVEFFGESCEESTKVQLYANNQLDIGEKIRQIENLVGRPIDRDYSNVKNWKSAKCWHDGDMIGEEVVYYTKQTNDMNLCIRRELIVEVSDLSKKHIIIYKTPGNETNTLSYNVGEELDEVEITCYGNRMPRVDSSLTFTASNRDAEAILESVGAVIEKSRRDCGDWVASDIKATY